MYKFLSCLCVSILLLGVSSCTETEKSDSDITIQEQQEVVQVADEKALTIADVNVIISVGDSEFTIKHAEWLDPIVNLDILPKMADWWLNNELLYAEAVEQGLGRDEETTFRLELAKKQLYAKVLIEKTRNDAHITNDEIMAYYEENKNTNPTLQKPAKLDVVHIQVKTIADANAAIERIKSGETAEEVAKQVSIARDASKGGVVINYTARNVEPRLRSNFLKTLSDSEIGHVLGPVKLKNGNYEVAVLSDKIPAVIKTFEETKEQIEAQLSNKAKNDAHKNLIEGLKAKAADRIVESETLKKLRSTSPPKR